MNMSRWVGVCVCVCMYVLNIRGMVIGMAPEQVRYVREGM